jgi:uncharacterized protein YbcI
LKPGRRQRGTRPGARRISEGQPVGIEPIGRPSQAWQPTKEFTINDASDSSRPGVDRQQLASITAGIVSIYRQHYGKGPTKAKTQMVDDTIICELENFSTTVEKTLLARGEHEHIQAMRIKFQDALEEELTEVVESTTGRTVRAFLSQSRIEPEVALEIFLLEPEDAD